MELQETTLRNTNTICDASDTGVQKDKHQKKTDMLSSDMETNTNHGSTEEMTMLKIDDFLRMVESVRWLRTKERYSDAKSILRRMARWNHKELDETAGIERPIISTKRTTPLDLFRRNLVVSTLAQGCLWFVNGLVYYGLSLSADDLGGSMYLNFVYVSLAEIPSAICAADFSNRFGRKRTTVVALILAGVFCISVPYIPLTEAGKPSRLAVGLLGKFFLTLSFDIITIWSVELFPTDLRSKGLSFVYMCGNVGSTASPWIAKGLKVFSDEVPFIVMGVSALVGGAVGLLLEETNGRDAKDTLNEFLADGVDNKEGKEFLQNHNANVET
uniref:Uncharacterized protein n=1 Tax=Clytia hemisphaerica TaxID=252671 RepID=A0A7M5V1J1_9CNID